MAFLEHLYAPTFQKQKRPIRKEGTASTIIGIMGPDRSRLNLKLLFWNPSIPLIILYRFYIIPGFNWQSI